MTHISGHPYIGWDEVFGTSPPEDGLTHYLRRLPKTWLIDILGKIGTTLFNNDDFVYNPQQQIDFTMGFQRCSGVSYAERIARIIANDRTSVFAHPAIVCVLVKYAILLGCDDDHVPGYAWDHLLRSMLLMNSKYGEARLARTGDPRDFLAYEIELMLAAHSNASFYLARYYGFMKWARSLPDDFDDYLPVRKDFERMLGMSYEDYATAAIALFNPFTMRPPIAEWSTQNGIVDMEAWVVSLKETGAIRALFRMLSLDMTEASEELAERPNSYGLADLRPFVDRPLLTLGESRFACPYQGFLRTKLGEGLYWTIHDAYGLHFGDEAKRRFTRFFGHFFEAHVFGLLRDSLAQRSEVAVFPDRKYVVRKNERKTPDTAIFVRDIAIFVEATHTRFLYDAALCDRRPEAVESSIKAIFLKKAKQLDGRIRDFLAGAYSFDGVDVANVKRIFPIIVTEQSVPQVISLWRRIREVIAEHGFLQDWEFANFACAEEIEMLFMGSDGRLDLEGILTRKAVSPYAQRDITLYLAECERERLVAKPDVLLPDYKEMYETIVRPTFARWGLAFT